MKGMNANRRIVQQVGMQVSDLGVQIAGGQSALLSLTQNVPQVVQMFGAWGGILAAVITLLGTFTLVMVKSGKSFADVAEVFGVAEESVMAFQAGLDSLKNTAFNSINFIVNNLDTLLIGMTLIVGYIMAKKIPAFLKLIGVTQVYARAQMIAALGGKRLAAQFFITTLATNAFNKALMVTQKLLMKLLPVAIFTGLAFLIERFYTLVQEIGSFGEAVRLLGSVAGEVFGVLIPAKIQKMIMLTQAKFQMMKAQWLFMLAGMTDGLGEWAEKTLATILGVVDGAKAGFNALGAMMLMAQQGNFKAASNIGANIGTIVSEAFANSLEKTKLAGSISDRLMSDANAALSSSTAIKAQADAIDNVALPALDRLRKLMANTGGQFDIRNLLGKGDKKTDDDIDSVIKQMNRMKQSFQNAIATMSSVISDNQIDRQINKIIGDIRQFSDLPAPKMDKVVEGIEVVRSSLKSAAPEIRSEIANLSNIMSSDLLKVDPEKFFAQTEASTLRIQELLRPFIQQIEDIKKLDPSLRSLNTTDFINSIISAEGATRSSVQRIRELIGSLAGMPVIELPDIDLKPVDAMVTKTKEGIDKIKEMGEAISDSLMAGFKGLVKGTKSLKDVMGNILDTIIDKMLEVMLNPLFDRIGGSISKSIGGWLPSFDGGGHTGRGVRIGGLDGKGGSLAVVHPNETVIDHTKPMRAVGGGRQKIEIQLVTSAGEMFENRVAKVSTNVAADISQVQSEGAVGSAYGRQAMSDRQRMG
jgi:hypothetical protein